MALTFKQAPVPVEKPVEVAQTVQSIAQAETPVQGTTTVELVKELITLHTFLTAMGAFTKVKRLDEVKKALQSAITDMGADPKKPFVFKCELGEAEFSTASSTTEIVDKQAMIKALGPEVFSALAKVGITDLKTYLSGAEIESFTKKSFGSRTLKNVKPT